MASEGGASEAQRVIGAGVVVTIAGEERRLLFTFQALELIEDEFDGLLNFTRALNGGYGSRRLKALRVGLLAGGAHAEVTRDEVDRLLEKLPGSPDFLKQIETAIPRIIQAWDQAMPPAPKDKRMSKALAREKGSHGPASSAGRSSNSNSASASSAT